MSNRLACAMLASLALAGCYYKDPYANEDKQPPKSGLTLERAFLTSGARQSEATTNPTSSFAEGEPVQASAVLSGEGRAVVKFVLLPFEGSPNELAAVQVNADENHLLVTQSITESSGRLAPGTYYVSFKVNDVPSWGVPFTVLAKNAGGMGATVDN